jgi:S1-C subfamily serine protease
LAECKHRIRHTPVLVPVPREWADAMFSLVKLSGEHRHNGLIVTNVGPGSQAARVGIVRGDVLLRYDGVELDSATAFETPYTKRNTQGAEASRESRTSTIEAARSRGREFRDFWR